MSETQYIHTTTPRSQRTDGYGLAVVTAPSVEPVTLAEAITHARIDSTADTDEIEDFFIPAARQAVERDTHRQLITATYDLTIKRWARRMPLPLGNLQSVTSVQYYDGDNAQQTLASSNYIVNTSQEPGFVEIKPTVQVPTLYDRTDAIVIRFVCGYGDAASDVPQDLRLAVLARIANRYEHRGDDKMDNEDRVRHVAQMYRLGDTFTEYAT